MRMWRHGCEVQRMAPEMFRGEAELIPRGELGVRVVPLLPPGAAFLGRVLVLPSTCDWDVRLVSRFWGVAGDPLVR